MEIVEFWHVRRVLLFQTAAMAVVVLFAWVMTGHVSVSGDVELPMIRGFGYPLSGVAPVAMTFAAIFGSIVGTLFRRTDETVELLWTRPIGRRAVAWRFIAIDLLGLVASFVLGYVMVAAIAGRAGVLPALDADAGIAFALALGVAAMWYGLTLVLSTLLRGGLARSISGVLWPVALIALALGAKSPPPTVLHAAARWLDVVNPLAYMQLSFRWTAGAAQAIWPLAPELRTAIVWLFAAAFCAVATELWMRREI
jgi:ABC-type transport system involved in multi-copper enzyme maturation permease subunit